MFMSEEQQIYVDISGVVRGHNATVDKTAGVG